MENRAGRFVENLSGEMAYLSFRPSPLPPDPPIAVDAPMLHLPVEANKNIAVLEGLSSRIPNVGLFISMYVRKEALLSSQIEGTQCTPDDILDPFAETNANADVSDVVNVIRATEFAVERLKNARYIPPNPADMLEAMSDPEAFIHGKDAVLKLSYNTVAAAVAVLEESGILRRTGKAGKARIYSYADHPAILRKDT